MSWKNFAFGNLTVHFGDNDAVRFALIKGSAQGEIGNALIYLQLELESELGSHLW